MKSVWDFGLEARIVLVVVGLVRVRVPYFCFMVGWLVFERRVGWMWLNVQCADDG